jgi:hypothetical protein
MTAAMAKDQSGAASSAALIDNHRGRSERFVGCFEAAKQSLETGRREI